MSAMLRLGASDTVQAPGHYSPDSQVCELRDLDVGVPRVLGGEHRNAGVKAESFYGHFPVEHSDHDMAVLGTNRAVHDELVPVENAGPNHAVTAGTDQEC